jgi:hypothetical protein
LLTAGPSKVLFCRKKKNIRFVKLIEIALTKTFIVERGGFMMYYCLRCGKPHERNGQEGEIVFKTGFHFVLSVKYAVGLCSPQKNAPPGNKTNVVS